MDRMQQDVQGGAQVYVGEADQIQEEGILKLRVHLLNYVMKSGHLTRSQFDTLTHDGRRRGSNPNDMASTQEIQTTSLCIGAEVAKRVQTALDTITHIDEGWFGICTECEDRKISEKRAFASFSTVCVECQEVKEQVERAKRR